MSKISARAFISCISSGPIHFISSGHSANPSLCSIRAPPIFLVCEHDSKPEDVLCLLASKAERKDSDHDRRYHFAKF